MTASLQCHDCGAAFEYQPGERSFFEARGWPPPVRCPGCRAARMAELSRHVCRECGTPFVVTTAAKRWFEERGLRLPTRCRACRAARRGLEADAAALTGGPRS